MNRKPLIGITAEGHDMRRNVILPEEYTDAVLRAGGLPVILPSWRSEPATLLARIDGLILAGGGDIDPVRYGGNVYHPALHDIDRERDAFEIESAELAVTWEIPTLGICRGLQIINVALGGTLKEHLPDTLGETVIHRGDPPAYAPHPIRVDPRSRLGAVIDAEVICPLSWHHQAIAELAPELRAAAVAEDGCIEGVELFSHPFYLGVQWHPEMTAATGATEQRLFDALVQAASKRQTPVQTPPSEAVWS